MKKGKFLIVILAALVVFSLFTFSSCADVSLSKLEITTMPTKIDYINNEDFNSSGLVVSAVYASGQKIEVTDYTISDNALTAQSPNKTITHNGLKVTLKLNVLDLTTETLAQGVCITGCGKDYTSVVIPQKFNDIDIVEISGEAFVNHDKLKRLTLPSSISIINAQTFSGCSALTQIVLSENNPFFSVKNGLLLNSDGDSLIYFLQAKKDSAVVLPSYITTIESNAFINNTTITSINLSNVSTIFRDAFKGCLNLKTIVGDRVNFIEETPLEDTAFIKQPAGDFSVIGNVLVKYHGSASEVELFRYFYIASQAFIGNSTLTSVRLGGNLVSIGSSAFRNCTSLDKVIITNNNNIIFISDNTFENNAPNRKIFVPSPLLQDYKSNIFWQKYL